MMKKSLLTLLVLLLLTGQAAPAAAAPTDPAVKSETAVLINADTGQVLYKKDMDKRMYPASITKIMTGLLALEKGELNDTVKMSDAVIDDIEKDSANIALDYDEEITLEQALYAVAVASANDAANGIAETVGGTMDDFVRMMNEEAAGLGAVNTHFNNANGMPDDNHYTTARDMALITAKALKAPGFAEIFGTKRYTIPPTNKQPEARIINSSNRFLNGDMPYEGMLLSKAGWTYEAQHTLVTAARRNGITLVAVVMKSSVSTDKWADTTALLDYGFNELLPVTLLETDILKAAPEHLTIPGHGDLTVDTVTFETPDVVVLLPKDTPPEAVEISYGEPQMDAGGSRATIPVTGSPYKPSLLTETTVMAEVRPAVVDNENQKQGIGVFGVVLIVTLSIIGLLLLAFIFLVIRRAIIVRRRRRRKQQKMRQAAASRYR